MDHPVISPWIIYLISVLGNLGIVVATLTIVMGVATVASLIIFFSENDIEDFKEHWKIFAGMITAFIFITIIAILIPSRNEMYAMVVANEITYERVNKILGSGKDLRQQLLEDASFVIQQLRCSPEEGKNSCTYRNVERKVERKCLKEAGE